MHDNGLSQKKKKARLCPRATLCHALIGTLLGTSFDRNTLRNTPGNSLPPGDSLPPVNENHRSLLLRIWSLLLLY